ncbi:MAG: endopeptidase La [Syntrophobacterales bacterium]|nr:endopeptidase La [Syntrophobacterales bacterium]
MFKLIRPKERDKSPSNNLTLPLLPLRDIVVFTSVPIPLFVGRERSIKALEKAHARDKKIFLAAQRQAKLDVPKEQDIYRVGVVANILQILRLPDGTVKVLVEGEERGRITRYIPDQECFMVEVEILEEEEIPENRVVEIEALCRGIVEAVEEYAKYNKKLTNDVVESIKSIDDPYRLVEMSATYLPLKLEAKQSILEALNLLKSLELVLGYIRSEIEIAKTEERIKTRIKKQMEKTQREYYLNEQMKAIQKEMGEKDDFRSEIEELEKRIKKKRLPKEAASKVRAEFKKLKFMSPMSAEATVVRNYIDWILSVPWFERTKDKIDIKEAARILEEDHFGLEKPKERILEYLAVQSLVDKMKGPILCFVGPPGVGKTSLARSIARAMNRNFVRLSLGGVRDEAEIRGHRRTYIGALPGKIIQSMKRAKTKNPVMCLDEIDKLSSDFRGDPAAALLEVLDPEQNYAFNDHYLDLDYDLSEVFFITTANTLHSIPLPLQDRMEIIRIPGYTEWEKLQIAKHFLVKKQCSQHGISQENLIFPEEAILFIIRHYTKEAGVRNLEREIASICRKVAKEVAEKGRSIRVELNEELIQHYLGVPKYRYGQAEEKDEVGLAMGLAWTEFGGEILGIEVVTMPGKGKVTITGKLGEVMQESAQAAVSYVRSRVKDFGIAPDFHENLDIHIHVPEGAIPKDGPSAGITMATAIVSALTGIPVRHDVAMTGEITLRGRVLPIGGLKEKILAAHRAKISTVLIPAENIKDLKEIPEQILKDLHVEPVTMMEEVLRHALLTPEKLSPQLDSSSGNETERGVYDPREESNVVTTDSIC